LRASVLHVDEADSVHVLEGSRMCRAGSKSVEKHKMSFVAFTPPCQGILLDKFDRKADAVRALSQMEALWQKAPHLPESLIFPEYRAGLV
jgi:hypothetical protein